MAGFGACGFHTERWATAYRQGLALLVPDEGRAARAGPTFVSPLSTDPDRLRASAADPAVAVALARIEEQIGGADRQVIVRVDRMELSKNLLRGFWAFDELLERQPQRRERVVFVALAYPTRQGLPEYLAYQNEVESTVARINQRWGTPGWTPIVLEVEDDYPRSLAALSRYDVLLVNPVRDGLNLVAKEGPLINTRHGVLALSREAGAFDELGAGRAGGQSVRRVGHRRGAGRGARHGRGSTGGPVRRAPQTDRGPASGRLAQRPARRRPVTPAAGHRHAGQPAGPEERPVPSQQGQDPRTVTRRRPPPPPREHSRRRPRPPRPLPSPPCSVRPGRQRRAGRRGRRPGNRPPSSPGPGAGPPMPLSTSRAGRSSIDIRPGWARSPVRSDFGGDGLGDPGLGLRGLTPVDGDGQTLALDLDTGRGGRDAAGPLTPSTADRHRSASGSRMVTPASIRPLEAVESDEPETGGDPARAGAVIGWSMTGRGQSVDQERNGPTRHHGHHTEPPGQPGQQLGYALREGGPRRGRPRSGDSVPSKSRHDGRTRRARTEEAPRRDESPVTAGRAPPGPGSSPGSPIKCGGRRGGVRPCRRGRGPPPPPPPPSRWS